MIMLNNWLNKNDVICTVVCDSRACSIRRRVRGNAVTHDNLFACLSQWIANEGDRGKHIVATPFVTYKIRKNWGSPKLQALSLGVNHMDRIFLHASRIFRFERRFINLNFVKNWILNWSAQVPPKKIVRSIMYYRQNCGPSAQFIIDFADLK